MDRHLGTRVERWRMHLLALGLAIATLFSHSMTAHAFGLTQCAADRAGSSLNCTANDVQITNITVAGGPSSCIGGNAVTLDLNLTVNFGSSKRYDIGIFISNDGKDPKIVPSGGGAASCSVAVLPTSSPFANFDPGPWGGVYDTCGDGSKKTVGGGSGRGVFYMPGVTVACQAISGSSGNLFIPFVVSWDNQASPSGGLCRSAADPVPGSGSKCNAPVASQGAVAVVVLPTITKTDNIATIISGGATTYTVAITNTAGATLSNAVFKDPAVTGINVSGVSCTAAGGATCPASPTVAAMQGAGITIPSMPVNSSVSFTINATLTGTPGNTRTNTATVTVANQSNSASDTDTLIYPNVAENFNAFESSTAAGAINGVIITRIAGSAFSLDVVAINVGAQAYGFSNAVKVELLANTGTPGSGYGANNCPTANAVIQTIASANISGGRSTVSFPAVADAYRDVRVRISYPTTSPTVTSCSTNSFAIRPNTLAVSATDSDWQTAGTARPLNNTAASGGVMHKAGQFFTISAAAYNAAGTPAVTTNYAGSPTTVLSVCGGAGCTPSFGTFALGATNFVAGVFTSNLATYSEVGAFNLTLQDTTFAAIDSPDTAASCAGYYVCSAAAPVGRFVPDHFDTSVLQVLGVPMPCPSGLTCPVSYNGFVYSGQPFTTRITARNAGGATTVLYSGALARTVTLSAWDAPGSTATSNPGPGALAGYTVPSTAFGLGVATTAAPTYALTAVPTAPTDIYLRAADTENVTSLRGVSSVEGGVKVISGRIRVQNAYGYELLSLPIGVTVQYWNGTAYVTSDTDSITTFANANVVFTNCQKNLGNPPPSCKAVVAVATPPASVAIVNGVGGFKLSPPGAGNNGSADMTINAPSYLPSTTGRATFGIYKSKFIYLREMY